MKIIGQCDIKHILRSTIKTFTSVLKILSYIITARPVELAAILAIMTSELLLFYMYCDYHTYLERKNSNLTVENCLRIGVWKPSHVLFSCMIKVYIINSMWLACCRKVLKFLCCRFFIINSIVPMEYMLLNVIVLYAFH